MKRIPILPTLVTLGNAFCGFLAIGYILKAQANPEQFGQHIGWAGWMILIAMIFDALDGKVARMSCKTSNFGAELDSLCDVISFGVAPALIVKALAMQQDYLEPVGWATSILFMMCATLRLARFNVETEPDEASHLYFKGLPTPGAAAFIAAMTIMFYELRGEAASAEPLAGLARALEPVLDSLLYVMPFVAVILAVLMISNVRYMHVLNKLLHAREPLDYLVKLILIVIFVALTKPYSMPLVTGIYILSGPIISAKRQIFTRVPAKAGNNHIPSE